MTRSKATIVLAAVSIAVAIVIGGCGEAQAATSTKTLAKQVRVLQKQVKTLKRVNARQDSALRDASTNLDIVANALVALNSCLLAVPAGFDDVLNAGTSVTFDSTPPGDVIFSPLTDQVITTGGSNFALFADPACVSTAAAAAGSRFHHLRR